jgi:hypothetical protein
MRDMDGSPFIRDLFSSSVGLPELLDAIPVGILVLDAERRVVALNRRLREWTGASARGAVGLPCREVVDHSACGEHCPIPVMAPADGIRCFASVWERGPGPSLPLSISVGPILESGGRIVGFLESVTADGFGFFPPNPEEPAFPDSPLDRWKSFRRRAPAPPEPTWADVEHRLILDALVRAGGKRTEAAKLLGWSRSTLWRKMKARGMMR